jgi:hypothetical protein
VVTSSVAGAADVTDDVAWRHHPARALPSIEVRVVEALTRRRDKPNRVAAEVAALELGVATANGEHRRAALRGHVDAFMAASARTRVTPTIGVLGRAANRTSTERRQPPRLNWRLFGMRGRGANRKLGRSDH